MIRDGSIAACPTKIASCRRSPESIFVKPAIESGSIPRTCARSASLVMRKTIQELHCESTVASTSLGRCETRKIHIPYFRPSFATLLIALCAASYWASPLFGTYRWASSQTSRTGLASRSATVCQIFMVNNVRATAALAVPATSFGTPDKSTILTAAPSHPLIIKDSRSSLINDLSRTAGLCFRAARARQ